MGVIDWKVGVGVAGGGGGVDEKEVGGGATNVFELVDGVEKKFDVLTEVVAGDGAKEAELANPDVNSGMA